jgi:Peptidase M15
VRATGAPGHNYFMTSFHHAIQEYTCGGAAPPAAPTESLAASCPINTYVDFYNFFYGVLPTFWSDFGTAEFPNSWYWIGPGPNSYAPAKSLSVGETYSNAQLRTPITCGDLRDQIAKEYVTYASPWLPACTQFNSNQSTGHYTFAQLNYPSPATAPAEFPWALFTLDFMNGVDKWATNFLLVNNYVPHVNRGYRDPKQNNAAGGVPGSRHISGQAADLQNVTNDTAGRTKLTNAFPTGGPALWVEPIQGPCKLACVHADWRNYPLVWVH